MTGSGTVAPGTAGSLAAAGAKLIPGILETVDLATLLLVGPLGRAVYHAAGGLARQCLFFAPGHAVGGFPVQQLRLGSAAALVAEPKHGHHLFIPALAYLQGIADGDLL